MVRKRTATPVLDWIAEPLRPLAVPLADLHPDPENARLHPDRNLQAIEASLRRYGQRRPLVVRRADMVVEAGHGLLEVARRIGWTHVAALLVDDDRAQAIGYGLADNRSAELAEWDDGMLGVLLRDLRQDEAPITDLGWDDTDLARLTAYSDEPVGEGPGAVPLAAGDAEAEPDDEDETEPTAEGARLMALLRPAGLKAPFPWFGGKRRVAGIVWAALGNPRLYVEPFAGSLAVLFGRPAEHFAVDCERHEHVNDLDAYVCNFWRAVQRDPAAVQAACDWPVNETCLLARHRWLVSTGRERVRALETDPEACDAKVAGWWVWGLSAWIGSGWCAQEARWDPETGEHAGRGLDDENPKLPSLKGSQLPHLGGQGVHTQTPDWPGYFRALQARLRRVRVCCGDWSRVLTLGATCLGGESVGIFLDPPYLPEIRAGGCYTHDGSADLTAAVRARALELGAQPGYRVVLAGYAEEHGAELRAAGWREVAWASKGAYKCRATSATCQAEQNRWKEQLWLSPSCLPLP